ncbi:hypothetical protein EI030_23245 [Escherichia coli]|nr:hypothetical protein [Escherichia coli]EFH8053182.1 hypothetical protein [Escherichia coli]MQH98685.1 hypothetical protein [Escherichia coli]MQL15383.1 hypothetical protein [Escherichia coli]
MKNIAAQMVNFDREQMRRIANNMPEQYDEKPQVQQVAQIINGVFSQLLATFPASLANRDQNELNEIRRQWVITDGRINFIEPSTGLEKKGNSKGSMLLIWRPFISPRRMFTTVSKAALMAIGQGVRRAA